MAANNTEKIDEPKKKTVESDELNYDDDDEVPFFGKSNSDAESESDEQTKSEEPAEEVFIDDADA